MGYNLTVLIPTTPEFFEEDYTLKDIYEDLVNDRLSADFPGVFDYFSWWNNIDARDTFFGKDNPQRMVNLVSGWNQNVVSALKKELEKIVKYNSVEELLEYLDSDWINLYHLRDALDSYDNSFRFGEDRLVYHKTGETSIRIPEDVLEDILEHPEDYAAINVVYH